MRFPTWFPVLLLFIGFASASASEPARPRLLIAFSSLRAEPLHPTIYFYEHDGKSTGRIVGKVAPVDKRSDHHPSLGHDGRLCAFAAEVVSNVCTIECWNRDTEQPLTLASLNKSPNAQMAPSIGASGPIVCFEAWNRPGSAGRWDLLLYNVDAQVFLEAPNLNTSRFDERKPALSGDGRWLAFTTNSRIRQLSEIAVYDRDTGKLVSVPNLNSPFTDTEPSISHDGRFIAFVTDRPGGEGARDIKLYDRQTSQLVVLPGLNSVGQEQSPSISPDGRFIGYVSERLDGAGERDIYVYDRDTKSLLPLPGLNSPRDEYDPCVMGLSLAD